MTIWPITKDKKEKLKKGKYFFEVLLFWNIIFVWMECSVVWCDFQISNGPLNLCLIKDE